MQTYVRDTKQKQINLNIYVCLSFTFLCLRTELVERASSWQIEEWLCLSQQWLSHGCSQFPFSEAHLSLILSALVFPSMCGLPALQHTLRPKKSGSYLHSLLFTSHLENYSHELYCKREAHLFQCSLIEIPSPHLKVIVD